MWSSHEGHVIPETLNSIFLFFSIPFRLLGLAFCMQSSGLKEKPHEIHGEISFTDEILSKVCSCKAGLGEKCKHIVGTLLYCHT
jgi:hypothetical protein